MDPNTIIVGDLNTLLSPADRSSRPPQNNNNNNNNKETSELKETINQSNGFNSYLQNILPNSCRIHIFLSRP
jgi:hypothetical protein